MRHFGQYAIETCAHTEDLFVGLKVNIRCAALDRIQQNLVDEADDRGIFDVILGDAIFFLIATVADVQVLKIEILIIEARHGRIDLLERLADALHELRFLDHHRIDAQAGLELDVIDRLQVGRVRDAEKQALAAHHER